MIQVQEIAYKAGDKFLVQNISVDLAPGKLNLIIGPNGAGKSTFIKLLSGQLHPYSGTIIYNGRPLKEYTISELALIRSVLSQNIELSFPLNVWEVVMMGRYPHFTGKPAAKDVKACKEAMEFFNISDLSGRDYTTLSGGEKQRVQFARILTQIWYATPGQYRYLFLDEPLTFLDVRYQYEFMHQLIKLLSSGDLIVIGVVGSLEPSRPNLSEWKSSCCRSLFLLAYV